MIIRSIILTIIFFVPLFASTQPTLYIKFKSTKKGQELIKVLKNEFLQDNTLNKLRFNQLFKQVKYTNLKLTIGLKHIFKLSFTSSTERDSFIKRFSNNNDIDYLQTPQVLHIDYAPNDSLLDMQWGIKKIGALETIDLINVTGLPLDSILIGLIDTGINDEHPDLKNSIFINYGETGIDYDGKDKRFNGIDDDDNGFVDDFKGWDFVDSGIDSNLIGDNDFTVWDNDPNDENGHGTSIAGIISAEHNNETGIVGVSPNAKIINIRAFNALGEGEDDDVAAAILYAVNNGARIINMSFGDSQYSAILKDVIDFAYENGVILVGSSGNSSSDMPHYPSSFSNVINIGASDENDFVASFSNFGSNIDLVAPGVNIYSTSKDGKYKPISGTSAATPFVSGAIAVILGLQDFTSEEIKQLLKSTAVDINSRGWDLQSGAGRLNLLKAVQSLSRGIVRINAPQQDFSTSDTEVPINITVLSPYFDHYELYYGKGITPENWKQILIPNANYQTFNRNIPALNVTSFADTVYTLRLVAALTNGKNQEERVNFYIDRTPPNLSIINLGPAVKGNKNTIISSIVTNEISSVKMFFREKEKSDYSYITLDEFSSTDKSFRIAHYGFIPTSLIEPGNTYEIYFEAENLAGLKNQLFDNGKPFELNISESFNALPFNQKPYKLPKGNIFSRIVNVNSNSYVLLNKNNTISNINLVRFSNNNFVFTNSLLQRLPKSVGDFNGNGLTDILSLFVKNGYIDEQSSIGSTEFKTLYADSSGDFWPATAMDLDNDGKTEIISFDQNSSMKIWQVESDLTLSAESEIQIFGSDSATGFIGAPNVIVDDIDNDGKKEIWTMDNHGSLYSIIVEGINLYTIGQKIDFNLSGIKNVLTSGDYDGDNRNEIAVLLKSNTSNDIAPFYILNIFNILNGKLNIISSKAFLDVSSKYPLGNFVKTNYSLNFADIDNDNYDELLINMYPFFYVLKKLATDKFIYFMEGVNSKNIFVGDLDKNSVTEIGLSTIDSIRFYEFNLSNSLQLPIITDGFSVDSNHIYIEWNGNGTRFRIYRGKDINNLLLVDSTSSNNYTDTVSANKFYYYSIQKFDSTANKYSEISPVKEVYSHQPAELSIVKGISSNNILATFSSKINVNIASINSFIIDNSIYPNSIIANSENSYLISLQQQLPEGEHLLTIKNLKDFYNSPIDSNAINFTISSSEKENKFFITQYSLINSNRLQLHFNLDLDKISAMNKNNFNFTPSNIIKDISVASDSASKLTITTQYPMGSIGKEYTLKISGVYSSEASGKILISDGAGSSVILSSFANNLDDVYNYPNPVKITENSFVTFANLTKNCEIYIFSLNGKPINKLVEQDGNGGINWDLTNKDGIKIDSGIYLYIVRALDNDKNIIQEKLGKIAVLK